MTEWKEQNNVWSIAGPEQLAPDRWLVMWRREWDHPNLPFAWIYVMDCKWESMKPYKSIEVFELKYPSGLLEVESIAHAMREKYSP